MLWFLQFSQPHFTVQDMQSLGDDSDADLDDEDSEEETPAKKVVIEFN